MNTEWTEQDSAAVEAAMVAHDGHRMALKGAARAEAIRMMAHLGLSADVMAVRLRSTPGRVNAAARRAGVSLPREDMRRWLTVARTPQLRERDRQRSRRTAA